MERLASRSACACRDSTLSTEDHGTPSRVKLLRSPLIGNCNSQLARAGQSVFPARIGPRVPVGWAANGNFDEYSVRQDKPGAFSGCNSRPGKGKSRPTGNRVLGS